MMAVLAGLLGSLHQFPALVQREAGGNFGGGVLAGPHGRDADRGVILPRRGGHHQVDIVALAQAQEIGLAAVVERRGRLAGLLDPPLGAVEITAG